MVAFRVEGHALRGAARHLGQGSANGRLRHKFILRAIKYQGRGGEAWQGGGGGIHQINQAGHGIHPCLLQHLGVAGPTPPGIQIIRRAK